MNYYQFHQELHITVDHKNEKKKKYEVKRQERASNSEKPVECENTKAQECCPRHKEELY